MPLAHVVAALARPRTTTAKVRIHAVRHLHRYAHLLAAVREMQRRVDLGFKVTADDLRRALLDDRPDR